MEFNQFVSQSPLYQHILSTPRPFHQAQAIFDFICLDILYHRRKNRSKKANYYQGGDPDAGETQNDRDTSPSVGESAEEETTQGDTDTVERVQCSEVEGDSEKNEKGRVVFA